MTESGNESQLDLSKAKSPLAVILGQGPVNITAKLGFLSGTIQGNFNDKEQKLVQTMKKDFDELSKILSKQGTITIQDFPPQYQNNETVKFFVENQNSISKQGLVDTLVYNKALDIAQNSNWGLKGIEATIAVPTAQLSAGISAQKLGVDYRESDGKVAAKAVE